MQYFNSAVDSVPEVRPSGDLRQDGQVRDGQLSVTGPPNASRLGFLCVPRRNLLSSPPDVIRYFVHFLSRGNESCVRKQRHIMAAGHQPRPGDFEKNNQRRATGDVRWPAHGTPMMGYPMCVVCPIAHITITAGALGLAALHIPLEGGPRAYQLIDQSSSGSCGLGAKAGHAMEHLMYSAIGVSRATYAGSKRSYSRLTTA